MRRIAGFVFQDDIILGTMTVREAITMSALLRLPRSLSLETKMTRVDIVIQLLRLDKCADTLIGSAHVKGVSGGERKRTAVAMEMITNPSILFCDEPTSGLDAFSAFSLCQTLKSLADAGCTVVATIHQPSSEVYHMFDELLLLADGRVMYMGELEYAVEYFGARGFSCPRYTNPADYFFMSILNDATHSVFVEDAEQEEKVKEEQEEEGKNVIVAPNPLPVPMDLDAVADFLLRDATETGSYHSAMEDIVTKQESPINEKADVRVQRLLNLWPTSEQSAFIKNRADNPAHTDGVKSTDLKVGASFSTQFMFLGGRAFKNALRNRFMVRARLGQTVFLGLLVGLIFLQIGDDQASVQNRTGALFFVATNIIMTGTMGTMTVFSTEKNVFLREFSSRYYKLFPYFASKILVELPFNIFFPFLYVAILYFLIGFQATATKFFIMAFTTVLLANCGAAFGLLVGSMTSDLTVAMASVPMILLPLIIFSGLLLNLDDTPYEFYWAPYISPVRYAYGAFLNNEMDGLVFTCTLPNGMEHRGLGCPNPTGEAVVRNLSFHTLSVLENCIILICIWVVLLGIGYTCLYRGSRRPSGARMLSRARSSSTATE
ncbi:ABC transporter [Capsaspora owczarzaki ATCC 30864]|nr:ABC transporter [Capsaspora owczarzaki ATCC 30864]|eukprot:XP_004343059.2 ABC transporter [Capsaspora owczarzaki ATCC 30864]